MQVLTTTIRKDPFVDILAGIKKIEYRELKQYWKDKLDKFDPPFLLRLINGMSKKAPELTVIVSKVKVNRAHRRFELHLGKVKEVKNWDIEKKIFYSQHPGEYRLNFLTKEYRLYHKNKLIYKTKRTANEQADIDKINRKINSFDKTLAKDSR